MMTAQLAPDGTRRMHGPSPVAFEHVNEAEGQAHVSFGQLGGGADEVAEKRLQGAGRARTRLLQPVLPREGGTVLPEARPPPLFVSYYA